MKKSVNINGNEWCDMVFENKNKLYGAYTLRQEEGKGYAIAFFLTLLLVVFVSVLPMLLGSSDPASVSRTTNEDIKYKFAEVNNIVKPKMELPPDLPKPKQPQKIKKTIIYIAPEIVPDDQIEDGKSMKDVETVLNSGAAIGLADVPEGSTDSDATPADQPVEYVEPKQVPEIVDIAEQMPEFPGGESALFEYLSKNVQYPSMDRENGIQGKVVIRFVVKESGEVSNVEVVRGVSPLSNNEALRVVRNMPKWIPGKQNGKAVPVYFAIPITFRLTRS